MNDILREERLEATEQMVLTTNTEELENEEVLEDVTDEEIAKSLEGVEESDDSSAAMMQLITSTAKKPISQIADDIVMAYMNDRSDKNWAELMKFFWYGIKQFSYKYTRNWEDANDMALETFERAFEKFDDYDPNKARFATWLWTICRNKCLSFTNKAKRIDVVDNDIADLYDSKMLSTATCADTGIASMDFKVDTGYGIHNVSKGDIVDELYNVSIKEMKNLKGVGAEILQMKVLDNMKIRQIAEKLNMNESTVKNYLYKTKENLSRILKINHKELYDMYVDVTQDDTAPVKYKATNDDDNMSLYCLSILYHIDDWTM